MIDLQRRPASALPEAQPQVQHQEPQVGGSFTRNIETGDIDKNEPAPADKTEKE